MLEFHQDSMDGITHGYQSIAIYDTLLAISTFIEGALDSSDAELVHEDKDGSMKVMLVELKVHLSYFTFYGERNRMEVNLGFHVWENREPIYVELDTENEEFQK